MNSSNGSVPKSVEGNALFFFSWISMEFGLGDALREPHGRLKLRWGAQEGSADES